MVQLFPTILTDASKVDFFKSYVSQQWKAIGILWYCNIVNVQLVLFVIMLLCDFIMLYHSSHTFPHFFMFSRLWIRAFLVFSFSSWLAVSNALLITTTTAMTPATLITVCLELDLQDCRWDISFPRPKETISFWRGTQDQAASLTSKKPFEIISYGTEDTRKLYLSMLLNHPWHPCSVFCIKIPEAQEAH